jgi:6,7-dimethyl-8-ribityllumazine synthase
MRVQLDTGVPIFSAVLTPRDFHEHEEHRRFFSEHFVKKGEEVTRACIDTLASLQTLPTLPAD